MEQNVDETDNLVFQAYRRDPLATFVLSRQGWKSWKFPIALAFLHEPSLLVFDEPWSSLDGDALELLRAVTADFGAQGGCGLFSVPTGQELEVVSADRIFVMENGGLRPL